MTRAPRKDTTANAARKSVPSSSSGMTNIHRHSEREERQIRRAEREEQREEFNRQRSAYEEQMRENKARRKKVVASIDCALSEMSNPNPNNAWIYPLLPNPKALHYHWEICMSKNTGEGNWMPALHCILGQRLYYDEDRLVDYQEFGDNHSMLGGFTDDELDKVRILRDHLRPLTTPYKNWRLGSQDIASSSPYNAWRLGSQDIASSPFMLDVSMKSNILVHIERTMNIKLFPHAIEWMAKNDSCVGKVRGKDLLYNFLRDHVRTLG